MKHQHPTLLIAEDDENDRFLLERAFSRMSVPYRVQLVFDGEEAIKYMMGEGKYADREEYPYPDFIITDLKMPRKDGLAVLEFLKKNPEWAIIPTVVFSGSANSDDIKKAYMLGASSYHLKPSTSGELNALVNTLNDYWRNCEVPDKDESGRRLRTNSGGRIGERYPQDGDAGPESKILR